MAGDDGRAALKCQHVAEPGDIIGDRGEGKLGCRGVVAVGLQSLDDRSPAGPVRPGTVNSTMFGRGRISFWSIDIRSSFSRGSVLMAPVHMA